ncbi:MAG TPA: hypothetical protein DDX06_06355, partial [Curvibacter sp.]|nr:hypothetical protein [Curvibacter sp.]
WARRFQISQIVRAGGQIGEVRNEGRWVIRDTRSLDWMKQPKQVGRETFASREAAEKALPLLAVSMKHRVVPSTGSDGGQAWEIWRDVSDRKRVKVVDQQFASRDDAMRYMAENAEAIIEANTTFGEADLPVPDDKRREGPQRRQGDVKGQDFMQAFGFRGVEFGNWNNQDERQELMNEAYDGLMDLADVMGIPPKAISLNGDLALAFGARGHGLSGARAHYEPDRAVMNLTKMKGAGALAHEWFHALDHYFGRQDGKAPVQWVTNKDGTRSLKVNGDFENNAVSSGFSRTNSGVREEVRAAVAKVMTTMARKAEQYVEDTAKTERFVAAVRNDVDKQLASIRRDLAEQKDVRYYKRNNKPATADQLAEFDAIAQRILAGEALDTELRSSGTKSLSGMRWTNDALEQISAIYKAVRGRSGFDTTNQSGILDRLRSYMGLYSQRLKMLAEAQTGAEKTKQVPTDFAMDARSLDQGRGTDYWTTPHEMAARAFQGYVEDKIAERGGKSPFLNYGPENVGILTPWGAKRPYPAGEERKAINAAFDELVKVIKTRETDQGVAMYARGGQDQTDTPAFKKWFGDSKVVDDQGKPMVVYHGAGDSIHSFVDTKGRGAYYFTPNAEFASGFAFDAADSINENDGYDGEYYSQMESAGANTMPVYLSAQNPFDPRNQKHVDALIDEAGLGKNDAVRDIWRRRFSAGMYDDLEPYYQDMQALGFDGFYEKENGDQSFWNIGVFRPEQIKSATGNRGTFDPSDPDITMARGVMDAAAFRRAFGAPEPMGVDRTQQIVDELTRTWENGPAFEIVATAAGMPGGRHPSDARGLILNGTAYIVAANNPTRDAVARTLGHEAIGHYGLWKMLGEDGTRQFRRNVQLAIKAGNKPITAIRDKVRELYVDERGRFNLTPEQEADEIAAFAVEEGIDPVTGEFRPGFGFLKSVWAKIAAFLRDTLGLPVRFTNTELQGLLVQSMRGLQVGQRLEGGADMMVAAARDVSPEGKALQALSENDDLFALPKSDKTTVEEIAAEQNPRIKVRKTKIGSETLYTLTMPSGDDAKLWVRPANPYGDQIYSMDLVDGDTSNVETGRPGENPEDVDPATEDVYLDVSNLKEGGHGNELYNIAATFAHNTGRIFIGDPSGLSDSAMRRRLENMISTALKFGTTDHIAPHPRQVKGDAKIGVPPLKWVYGDSLGNIRRMIDISLKAEETGDLPKYVYDPATGNLSPAETGGRPLAEKPGPAGWGVSDVSGAPAQRGRTGARAAIFRALLREAGSGAQGDARGRDGLLARLVSVGNQFPGAVKGIFYARGPAGAGQPSVTSSTGTPPATRQTNALQRGLGYTSVDAGGRAQFTPGAWINDKIGDLAGPMLAKLGLKAASPELRRMLRQMKLEVEQAKETAAAVAGEATKLSDAERAMVSDLVEKELKAGTIPPAHAVRLAAVINDAMGKQTDELIRLGMLTRETAEKWRGQYLPRYYESKLGKSIKDVWADSIGKMFRTPGAMKGIRGKHLKGRGLYQTIPESQLADFEALGWEVRDPDYQAGLTGDGTVQVWRDFTRQERDAMGEIRDAGFRFVMGYMQTQKDIALGRLFEALASNPEMSSRTETEKFSAQVPETKVSGTGALVYGKLAGRWVSPETLSQLSRAEEEGNEALRVYRKAMSLWKESKTVLNPVAHANNIISNVTMAHFAGVSYWRPDVYMGAIRDLVRKDPMVKEAKEAGLFLGTMSDAELMQNMPEELKLLAQKQEGTAQKVGRNVWDLMSFWLRKPMGAAYQAEDTFFRYLLYRDARRRGIDPQDAVDYAQKYIFTYDDLPKGARMIRDFGLPFFAYTYKAVPALLNTALAHPERMAAPAVVLMAANTMAYAIAAGDDEEDWATVLRRYLNDAEFREKVREKEKFERSLLPEWNKGYTALMTPKVIRLGNDELTGLPLFLDMSRMMPGGDLFDVNPNAGGIPLPQPITPSHPLITLTIGLLANKDLFRGTDLTDSNDTSAEKAEKRADWIWKQLSPAIAVNNYHWERTMNALAQATGGEVKYVPDILGGDATGRGKDGEPVQPKYAAMQTFGIKVRPIDLEKSELYQLFDQKKMIQSIDAEIRKLKRQSAIGSIHDRAFEKELDAAIEKKMRLREGLTVDGEERD